MSSCFKPDQYSTVSPYLIAAGAQKVIHWPAAPAHIHVYVEDVDATFDPALNAGGVLVQRPERKGQDQDRRGGVKDPAGNTWWIATQVA